MSNLNKLKQSFKPFSGKGRTVFKITASIFAVISFFVPYEGYIDVPIKIPIRYLIGFIVLIIVIIWVYIDNSKSEYLR